MRKRKTERDFERRWGKNRRQMLVVVPSDVAAEYKAKCKRLGLSQNRALNDLIRAFIDEPEDNG